MALPAKFKALADGNTDTPPPAIDWRTSPNFLPTLQEYEQMRRHIANLEHDLAEARAALLVAQAQAAVGQCANCARRLVK